MSFYTKFTIKNYRSFTEEQSLNLAVPQQGKLGSGITYIVGANNSGKTTLLEALSLNMSDWVKDLDRNEETEFKYYGNKTLIRSIKSNKKKSIKKILKDIVKQKNIDKKFKRFLGGIFQKQWNPVLKNHKSYDSRSFPTRNSFYKYSEDFSTILSYQIFHSLNYKNKNYFTSLIKKVIPEFTEWGFVYKNIPHMTYTSKNNITHKSDTLGNGVMCVIRILTHLYGKDSNSKSSLQSEGGIKREEKLGFIIDEPELALHPSTQKRLIKVIAEYAQDRQIILSTHSPYLINWEYIKNGAVLNRVVKENDTNSRIFTLGKYNKYKSFLNGDNWQQPFLMDVVSKEIFFQDNILFVEGQEDVGLLKPEFDDTEINFFGYGVRGCNNFEAAFELAKDLGIKKACALIDAPYPQAQKEESNLKKILQNKYNSQGYKIVQWNKCDIRDKKDRDGNIIIQGYFTKEGKKKKLEELDDFAEKIAEVKNYFI